MDCILGTGAVGKTIASQLERPFIQYTHSQIVKEKYRLSYSFDDVYVACVPAKKWLANENPSHDLASITQILEMVTNLNCNRIIQISTIDAAEPTDCYGLNRRYLEERLKLSHLVPQCLIVRLPMLIGKYVVKNLYYDALHPTIDPSQLSGIYLERYEILSSLPRDEPIVMPELTDPDQTFLVYDLKDLCSDITNALQRQHTHFECVTLQGTPMNSQEIVSRFGSLTKYQTEMWKAEWNEVRHLDVFKHTKNYERNV